MFISTVEFGILTKESKGTQTSCGRLWNCRFYDLVLSFGHKKCALALKPNDCKEESLILVDKQRDSVCLFVETLGKDV